MYWFLLVYAVAAFTTLFIFRWWRLRRYRLHLSTSVALMIVAGGLLGITVKPIRFGDRIGWPLSVEPVRDVAWIDITLPNPSLKQTNPEILYERYWGWPLVIHKPWFWKMDWDAFPEVDVLVYWDFNLVTCLFMLAMTLYLMEIIFSRRVVAS